MSSTEFRARIRKSLINPTLQSALDVNAERRVTKRLNSLESLPDWKERRQQAHAIRAEIIEHLDQYLDQFIAKAQSNGITVHRAKDAAEAVKIVLEIAKYSPRRYKDREENQLESVSKVLVAKSKSMIIVPPPNPTDATRAALLAASTDVT